ncbi:hypothetical protein B0H14DRAFT_3486401 [Mycena olivaceomarginata]|nr:hypothetical protein B0H14DRAFT_3486401 [Mycena olivaceomarginata]
MLPSVALPPPPSASTYVPPAAASPGSAAYALVAAIGTAQLRPTSRRHPGSPFTAALAARPSLGSPEHAAKREEDPYLVNIASTRRLATLPRLIILPRARRQDIKDRQGCYLLTALATFGIPFASAIAGHLPYLRRPSTTRPPPLTKLQITGRYLTARRLPLVHLSAALVYATAASLLWVLSLFAPPRRCIALASYGHIYIYLFVPPPSLPLTWFLGRGAVPSLSFCWLARSW